MALAAVIPLLLEAATLVPAIAKFFNAGHTAQTVAEEVGKIAEVVTGAQVPAVDRLKLIAESEQLKREFQIRIMDRMQAWDAMYLSEIQNARERDVKLAQAGYRNWRAHVMVASAYIAVIILVIMIWSTPNISEYVKGTFTLILGRMLGYIDQAFNFEFGTTRQSREKDDTIKKLSES